MELSHCHKLWFINPYIFETGPMSKNLELRIMLEQSLKYQRFKKSGCKDIGIRKFKWERLNSFYTKVSCT